MFMFGNKKKESNDSYISTGRRKAYWVEETSQLCSNRFPRRFLASVHSLPCATEWSGEQLVTLQPQWKRPITSQFFFHIFPARFFYVWCKSMRLTTPLHPDTINSGHFKLVNQSVFLSFVKVIDISRNKKKELTPHQKIDTTLHRCIDTSTKKEMGIE